MAWTSRLPRFYRDLRTPGTAIFVNAPFLSLTQTIAHRAVPIGRMQAPIPQTALQHFSYELRREFQTAVIACRGRRRRCGSYGEGARAWHSQAVPTWYPDGHRREVRCPELLGESMKASFAKCHPPQVKMTS